MFHNSRAARKPHGKQALAPDDETRTRRLLVWRKCVVCDWEDKLVEAEDAEGTCPRCHSLTELVAMAPPPAGGEPIRSSAAESERLREPKRSRAGAATLGPKQRAPARQQKRRKR
jgi:hypothetical protein